MSTTSYIKVPELSWASCYNVCQEYGYDCIEIMMVTKYPVNSEHIIGFSEITQTNINVAMVLYHYECTKTTLRADTRPEFLSDEDWNWVLPYLQSNNLLNHEIYVFWRRPRPEPVIQEIEYTTVQPNGYPDGYHYQRAKIFVYSNYIIRLWYLVNDVGCPEELKSLLDKGVVNSIYIRPVRNNIVENLE